MCGITGFALGSPLAHAAEVLHAMNATLRHRGPDAGDIFIDESCGIGLGHRRLAIVDLSPAGAQPMSSPSGRYTVVFNGEIYNFERLRAQLGPGAAPYRGHSDTEVMLHAFERWGVRAAIPQLHGMFALAVWDRIERRLILARDRVGKKPLYYGKIGASLLFGSELKALRRFPGWTNDVDRDALTAYLRHNYVPAPHSIHRGVRKLPPGSLLEIDCAHGAPVFAEPIRYWEPGDRFAAAAAEPFAGNYDAALQALDELLRDAVGLRMVADVPLGAFLSGGVDSSLVVALMQAQSQRPVKTYTIGFNEPGYDEAQHARAVAAHLGTDHTELYVSAQDALDLIPAMPQMFDEPFSDSSQLPTALVCAMARRHVTVALSGDGGDEGFCGYGRYRLWREVWRLLARAPAPLTRVAARAIEALPEPMLDRLVRWCDPILPGFVPRAAAGARLHALAGLVREPTASGIYRQMVSHWPRPEELVIGGREPRGHPLFEWESRDMAAFTQHMSVLDTATYLPDDILVKVDRASMAVSLEARSPLLDHRVLEFAWSLPLEFKLEERRGKRILWDLLYRYVPQELVDRPKTGFGVPIDAWLRGPLKDWADAMLDPVRLRREGYLRPEPIRRAWDEHQSRRRDWHYYLWDILMFQSWLEAQTRSAPPASAGGPSR